MTIAAAIGAEVGAGAGPGSGSGLRVGPEAGNAVSGHQGAGMHALASTDGTGNPAATSFGSSWQSSWQSMVDSLNGETGEKNVVEALKPAAVDFGNASRPAMGAQETSTNTGEASAAQAAMARFKLGEIFSLKSEADVAASNAKAYAQDLENSAIAEKSAHNEAGAHNSAHKKADKNLQSTQTAWQAALLTPSAVPVPVAVPQPPQNATGAGHTQSFLIDATRTGEPHSVAVFAGGITPALSVEKANANRILTPAANGISPAAGAARGDAMHEGDSGASLSSSTSTNALSTGGLQPAAPDANASADLTAHTAVNLNESSSDAIADASSAALASATSIGGSHAAHALAAEGKRSAEPTSLERSGPGAASSVSIRGHMPGLQAVQPVGTGGDSSAFARDGAAARAPAAALPVVSAGKAPGSGETFAALDADAAHGASWLHAGAHSAEAGFEDPALGWVSVRADLAAGGVHAAVVPGTAEAVQVLSTHMAGLNNYLNDQRTPVHTLTLSSPGGDPASNQGFNQGQANQEAGNREATNQGSGQDPASRDAASQQAARPIQILAHTAGDAAPIAPRMGASISLIA